MLNNVPVSDGANVIEVDIVRALFAKYLTQEVERVGMKSKKIATEAGLPDSALKEISSGQRMPSVQEIGQLVRALPGLRRDKALLNRTKLAARLARESDNRERVSRTLVTGTAPASKEEKPAQVVELKSKSVPEAAPVMVTVPPKTGLVVVKKDEQYSQIETVDAALAKTLLAGNLKNRKLSRALVNAIARDIVAGKWVVTHQGIALDPDYRLLDGQHRLHGIIAADALKPGITVQIMVTYNVKPNAFDVIDLNGRPRSLSDVMHMTRGLKNATLSISAVRILAEAVHGHTDSRTTRAEVDGLLDTYGSDLREVIPHLQKNKKLVQGGVAAAYAYAHPTAPVAVHGFASKMSSRIDMSPIMAVLWSAYDRLIPCSTQNDRLSLFVVTLRALRHHIEGTHVDKLYTVGAPSTEDPTIVWFRTRRARGTR